jgi:type I restriction enzyme S subunit
MNIEGWTNSSLISLLDVMKSGGTPNTSRSDFYGGEIPFVSIEDMSATRKYLQHTVKTLTKEGLKNSNTWLVPENSLLYSIYATLGLVRISKVTLATNQAILAMIVNPKVIDQEYLYYWLEYVRDSVINLSSQTTQRNLNATTVKTFIVQHPENKKEQKQIAEILSTIDRAIAQTEAIIAKQQRIKTGLMQDLLTKGIDENGNIRSEATHQFKDSAIGRIPVEWEVEPIEQKLERIIDYRGRTPKKVTEGVPLLTAKNVRDGFIEKEPQEFIADSDYNSWMTRGIPEVGDVLFTTEAPMGNVASIPNYRIALAQRLLTLCPKINELSQDFLFWILHWKRTTERFELLTSGSTVVGVKQSVFRKVNFTFPSYIEQQRICAVLNSHDEINKNEKHKLKKIQRLKTGLMQDLLTGKVRVTNLLKEREPTSL